MSVQSQQMERSIAHEGGAYEMAKWIGSRKVPSEALGRRVKYRKQKVRRPEHPWPPRAVYRHPRAYESRVAWLESLEFKRPPHGGPRGLYYTSCLDRMGGTMSAPGML